MHQLALAARLAVQGRSLRASSRVTPSIRSSTTVLSVYSQPAGRRSYLDAAEEILSHVNAPMSPDQIVREALSTGLITSRGKTPAQTLKAKLSTDILRKRAASRFMRTGKNTFGLRAWKDRYTEYTANRYKKALLDEEIIVFPREILTKFVARRGIHILDSISSEELLSYTYPMQRREAEEDFEVIQLVSAFLVHIGSDRLATYKRTARLPESRLHGVHSLLFGGHLNPEDVPPLFSIFDPEVGPQYIQRELSEELRFSEQPALRLVGVLYDTRRPVSLQHLGVLYDVFVDEDVDVEIGERGFLQQLRFETPKEILDHCSDFENWSELVLREYILCT